MIIKNKLYLLILIIFIGCNNMPVKQIEENLHSETSEPLIKDSSLFEEIIKFTTSLKGREINNDYLLMLKFDSVKYRNAKCLEILMCIVPCFSDTCRVFGGYIFGVDPPIIIIDKRNIGNSYYNNIILDKKIIQSFYCNDIKAENEHEIFYTSLRKETIVGHSFLVNDKTRKLQMNEDLISQFDY